MPQYVLRDIPIDIWSRFTTRAKAENWPLRALFLQWMDDFGQGRTRPTGAPPEQMPIYAWVRPYFRHVAKEPGFFEGGLEDQWKRLLREVAVQNPHAVNTLMSVPAPRRTQVLNWLHDTSRDLRPGPNRLSMRAIAHIGSGPQLMENRRAIQYEVLGLPPGEQAWIADFSGKGWRILQVVRGQQDNDWRGSYPTAQDALRAIEIETYMDQDPDATP